MKVYLISARNGEFVGFTDKRDANWTATGTRAPFGLPTLGESFREMYGEEDDDGDVDGNFPMIEIELTAEQVKALEIDVPKDDPADKARQILSAPSADSQVIGKPNAFA